MKKTYTMTTEVWLYPGDTPWHFVTLGTKESDEIKKGVGKNTRGFGSVPVEVTVGDTVWNTSIFPDKRSGAYLLPLKAQVRKREGIYEGDKLKYTVRIR